MPCARVAAALLALVAVSGETARPKRGELDPQTCLDNFDIQRDKIIRTEESREMGARYLSELDVGAREECLRLCCETDGCDVFVYEEKSPGSCYLFNCGPPEDFKCKFTRHTNFSSGVLAMSRHLAELQDQVRLSKHEHDLASLRKQTASTPPPPTTQPAPTPQTAATPPRPAAPHPTPRRCSPYQFECHGSGECIAIYNACDGVPQCADGSDEAAELACPQAPAPRAPPSPPPPPPPPMSPPREHLAAPDPKMEGAEVPAAPFLRPVGAASAAVRWPHRLMQAQPPPLNSYQDNNLSSHIFSHKGSLLQEGESQVQQQYMPYEAMQESQWVRRPWQQSIPMEQLPIDDRQLVYRYGAESAPAAWQPAGVAVAQGVRAPGGPALQPRGRPDNAGGLVDRDKMWAVPQAPLVKPEPPVYVPAKTMPEAPIMYSNQQETLRDSPKKGFDLALKTNLHPVYTQQAEKELQSKHSDTENTTKKEKTVEENRTKKKHLKESPATNPSETDHDVGKEDSIKHNVQHDHYKMIEDEHDGLSEKPPGAILLLILGVLMTTIMAVMLGCRLRVARRRMRRAGKSPFAHDADYLVNGMYL